MNSEEVATQIQLCLGRLLVDIKHLEEDKDGWKRLATKYYNALEDIKEQLKQLKGSARYHYVERELDYILYDIVNKALEVEDEN